jgi:NADPH:quinone reductase-like Zn-dependent oxidoreductase
MHTWSVEGDSELYRGSGWPVCFLPVMFLLLSGSGFGATAHDATHDAFMTLSPYTRITEGEARRLGLCVRKYPHMAEGRLKLLVGHTFPLEDAAEAQRHLIEGHPF